MRLSQFTVETMREIGSLYLSVTPVLHQTLNPTAELWCKTSSRIKSICFYSKIKP